MESSDGEWGPIESADSSPHIPAIPAPHRIQPGQSYDPEVKARCFVLYSTAGGRNCAAVERLYAREVEGTNEPVPSRKVIAAWAADEAWATQSDNLWRNTKHWTHDQLRVLGLANTIAAAQHRHDLLTGKGLDGLDNATKAMIQLKAGELSDRAIERILPLGAMKPPDDLTETNEELSRADREGQAKLRIVARKKDDDEPKRR